MGNTYSSFFLSFLSLLVGIKGSVLECRLSRQALIKPIRRGAVFVPLSQLDNHKARPILISYHIKQFDYVVSCLDKSLINNPVAVFP